MFATICRRWTVVFFGLRDLFLRWLRRTGLLPEINLTFIGL
jgi:hypothetical protein